MYINCFRFLGNPIKLIFLFKFQFRSIFSKYCLHSNLHTLTSNDVEYIIISSKVHQERGIHFN